MDDREDGLGEETAPTRRGGRRASFARDSRSMLDEREADERGHQEREQGDRELSDDDRLDIFRDSLDQSVLPDLPPMPGYHCCWLTTNNPRDTIARRRRIGYELIPLGELPGGWEGAGLNSADYPGYITVNEMIAARIPLTLYNRYMREVHHSKPLGEEEKLRATVDSLKNEAERFGARVQEGDGTERIVQRAPPMPDFLS